MTTLHDKCTAPYVRSPFSKSLMIYDPLTRLRSPWPSMRSLPSALLLRGTTPTTALLIPPKTLSAPKSTFSAATNSPDRPSFFPPPASESDCGGEAAGAALAEGVVGALSLPSSETTALLLLLLLLLPSCDGCKAWSNCTSSAEESVHDMLRRPFLSTA